MSVGPAAERPVIFSFTFTDGKIVDTCNAQAHQAVFIKLPVLVAVAAELVAAVIVPFILPCRRIFRRVQHRAAASVGLVVRLSSDI